MRDELVPGLGVDAPGKVTLQAREGLLDNGSHPFVEDRGGLAARLRLARPRNKAAGFLHPEGWDGVAQPVVVLAEGVVGAERSRTKPGAAREPAVSLGPEPSDWSR